MTWDLIEIKWAEMARRMRGDWKPVPESPNWSPADQGSSDPSVPIQPVRDPGNAADTDAVAPASP
jgi:hypothetical protein